MIIIGAGMTGCLAGILFPEAYIYEAQTELPINHNAVLRFRDDSVSKATGIQFRKVKVHKGIYVHHKGFVEPNIQLANMYSQKVLGHTAERSIWNLKPVERYIAPSDFQYQLASKVRNRILLDRKMEYIPDEEVISTMPLSSMLKLTTIETTAEFAFREIHTARFEIKNCDVFQTVYFPDNDIDVYRATVTGNDLIIESTKPIQEYDLEYILNVMFLDYPLGVVESTSQQYGKIKNIDEDERHRILYTLTAKHGVYSAGRFAIWKNVLMDDVLQDLYKIKKMMDVDSYNRHKMR